MIRIVPSSEADGLLARKAARFADAEAVVRPILEAVRDRGDEALLGYAQRFDGFNRATPLIPGGELAAAAAALTDDFKAAVLVASDHIRRFAEFQMPVAKWIELAPGLRVGQEIRALDTVACYVPAGRYPLPSTLMMTVIPAQVAGVTRICVTSPKPVVETLGTASLLGIPDVFLLGGAHAIAAFAFGTDLVPRADRIVGPGNIYVAAAKKLLAGEVGIDFIAGPTEILIIAAEGNPRWIAADMLAQAEHDSDASALLLTTSRGLAEAVAQEIEKQLSDLPTAAVARVAIESNSAVVLLDSLDQACELSNRFAPEHLSLHDPGLLPGIRHAGSVFLGASSPEAAGDYAAGPNHTLPTSGAARLRGGLSVYDYLKIISTQELSLQALRSLAPSIVTIARAEGLEAHARSVEVRLG